MYRKHYIESLFKDDVETRKKIIRDFIMDKMETYEDRLEIWSKTPEHLRHHHPYVLHLTDFEKKYGEVGWYDDFSVDRYGVMNLVDAYRYGTKSEASKEEARDFYANCMDLGVHSFTYDW